MKKWLCLVLAALLCMSAMTACADAKSKLGDYSGRLKKGAAVVPAPAEIEDASVSAGAPETASVQEGGKNVGPEVRVDSSSFKVFRFASFLTEKGNDRRVDVLIELKNVSGRTLYPQEIFMTAYDANGKKIKEQDFSFCGQRQVDEGESLHVAGWFNGFKASLKDVAYFGVTVGTSEYSNVQYKRIENRVLVNNGVVNIWVDNTTGSDIGSVGAAFVIETPEGELLDISYIHAGDVYKDETLTLRYDTVEFGTGAALGNNIVNVYTEYKEKIDLSTLGASAEESVEEFKEAPVDENFAEEQVKGKKGSYGSEVRIDDPFYEVVRSSTFFRKSSYSQEADVLIELKNVSGRTLYPDMVSVVACAADGTVIDEDVYAGHGPHKLEANKSMFVSAWLFDFEESADKISYFSVTVDSETHPIFEYAPTGADVSLKENAVYVQVENTTKTDIYDISAVVVLEDEEGTLKGVYTPTGGNSCILPGERLVLRNDLWDYSMDGSLDERFLSVYAEYMLD